jgi:hypothetical protein
MEASSAGRLAEGCESGLRASIEDMFSARDKIAMRLVGRGTHTDHMVASRRRQAGRGPGLCRLAVSRGRVDETSTVPGQFAPVIQIGNLPGEAWAGVTEAGSAPAGCRNAARTCDGGRRHRPGPRPALSPGGHRCAVLPGYAPRSASMRRLPFSQAGRIFPGQRGSSVSGSVKRGTVMHVHPGGKA